MKLCYEAAITADADIIFRLAQQLVRSYEDPTCVDIPRVENWMRRKIDMHIRTYQRIMYDGEVAGFFRLDEQADRTELDDFYILPEYRSRGIGTQVICHCLQIAKHPMYFYVFCENRRAISFYQRCGFQMVEQISKTRIIMAQPG